MATIATTKPVLQRAASPAHIGPFEVLGRLCENRDTIVWAASLRRSRGFIRTVALKHIKSDAATREHKRSSLLREAAIGAVLDHPMLCSTLDVGSSDDRPYLVCELIRGWNLRSVLATAELTRTPVPLAVVLAIVHSACEGAQHMHELLGRDGRGLGLVHRAIDDSNLMVAGAGHTKLVDFGLTTMTAVQNAAPLAGRAVSRFSAPEITSQGSFDRRADVYSLGALLGSLANHLPFQCSEDLRAVISCATAKRPRDRFSSARELQRAIEAVAMTRELPLSSTATAHFLGKLFSAEEPSQPERILGLEKARRDSPASKAVPRQGRTRVRVTRRGRSKIGRPKARPRRQSTAC